MLEAFRIKTIEILFFLIARAINTLAATEEKNKRPAESRSRANINKALDRRFEKLSLTQIAKEPVSALQGLAEWSDEQAALAMDASESDLAIGLSSRSTCEVGESTQER